MSNENNFGRKVLLALQIAVLFFVVISASYTLGNINGYHDGIELGAEMGRTETLLEIGIAEGICSSEAYEITVEIPEEGINETVKL